MAVDKYNVKLSSETKPLPRDEWDFAGLSDRLSDDQMRNAFVYEYCRESSKIRALVEKCRNAERSDLYRQLIKEQTLLGQAFEHFVEALVNCDAFPKLPALQQIDWVRGLWFQPALQCYWGVLAPKSGWDRGSEQIRGATGLEHKLAGSFQATEFQSFFPVVIDWRKTDEQIIEDLRFNILDLRPERFAKLAKGPRDRNQLTEVPFKTSSALDWLGVLRKRKNVSTWREYFQLQDQEFNRGDERARAADVRKAGLILDWIENGTPLEPKDFK